MFMYIDIRGYAYDIGMSNQFVVYRRIYIYAYMGICNCSVRDCLCVLRFGDAIHTCIYFYNNSGLYNI